MSATAEAPEVDTEQGKPLWIRHAGVKVLIPESVTAADEQVYEAHKLLVEASTLLRGVIGSPILDDPRLSGSVSSLTEVLSHVRNALRKTGYGVTGPREPLPGA